MKKKSGFGWLFFWLAFLLGVTFLFMVNHKPIGESLAVLKGLAAGQNAESPEETPPLTAGGTAEETPIRPDALPDIPPVTGENAGQEDSQETARNAAQDTPAELNAAADSAPGKIVQRPVYLIRLDRDGDLVAAKVERTLPASDTPMKDALEAAIRGPSADEEKRSLLSLIPEKVKILSATIQGGTAYINFSEDFLFNTYGIEGYAGQLRQIVWTATEFSTVKDVQILVEGKRIDYLGEGIWIGSPINRTSL